MAEQTFQFASTTFSSRIGSKIWDFSASSLAINAALLNGQAASLATVIIRSNGSIVISLLGSGEFSNAVELNGEFTLESGVYSVNFSLAGADLTNPYRWLPSNAQDIINFYNNIGTSRVAATFTLRDVPAPIPVVPEFPSSTGSPISGRIGQAITPVTVPAATGFPDPSYVVIGNLPQGLYFNPSTRIISGTPTIGGQGTIRIRALNEVGSDDWTVTYNFNSPPSFADATGDPISSHINQAITPVFVGVAQGTPHPTYAIVGSLPAGLTFDRLRHQISGTPRNIGSGTIRIRATNSEGFADWTVTYDFTGIPPAFADNTGDPITVNIGTAITPVTIPEATGTPAPTYAVVGSLPTGLGFNRNTRVISGTPTNIGSGTIRIRASNGAGTADWTVAYTFTRVPTAPSFADSTGDEIAGNRGEAITSVTVPLAAGFPIPTYAVVGALPAGLAFDATTRVISGTPTAAGAGTIRIRATNNLGMADWTVTYRFVIQPDLYVSDQTTDRIYQRAGGYPGTVWDSGISIPVGTNNPSGLAFDSNGDLYSLDRTTDLIYRRAGGYSGASWDAGIAVPIGTTGGNGIAFDSGGNMYLIDRITNRVYRRAGGYSGASWDAGIAGPDGASCYGIAIDGNDNIYAVSASSDNRLYRRTGGYLTGSWDEGITLPMLVDQAATGLTFDSGNNLYMVDVSTDRIRRRIGGYPGTGWENGIVGPAGAGLMQGLAFSTVPPTVPSFPDATGDPIAGVAQSAITPVTVPVAEGNPAPTYAVVGALPAGLQFNTVTRIISGTPTAAGAGTIRIRATNTAGNADWTVTFRFTPAPLVAPDFADDTGDPLSVFENKPLSITVPEAIGNPTPVYSVVGALPQGLNFNPATRVISGTPRVVARGTIRIRAKNSQGSDDWTVTYNIQPGVPNFQWGAIEPEKAYWSETEINKAYWGTERI